MARRKVVTTPMMKIVRSAPKGDYLGWGKTQVRKVTTEATSPKLLEYRKCVAKKVHGEEKKKKYASLREVQEAFRKAAHECKEEVTKKMAKLGEVG
jgi:hypothetical protein